MPQLFAGVRTEPPKSEPKPNKAPWAPMRLAVPLLEPAGDSDGRMQFLVAP